MAGENDVNILLSVDIEASETLKQLATLRGETEQLRRSQKELDKATDEGRVEFERLNTQIKVNTAAIRDQEKSIVKSIVSDNAKNGSLKQMRADLSAAKAAYVELSREEREGAKGKEQLNYIANLNEELKELETAYGDNQRKVGEYERAGKSLRGEMRELVMQLTHMKVAGQDNSATYGEMANRLAVLRDAMGDVNQQATQQASDTSAFDTANQGIQSLTQTYMVWKTTSAALGVETTKLDETMQKLMIVMGALQSLTVLQNLAQKQTNIYRASANFLQLIGINQTAAETKAIAAKTAMQNAGSLSTKAAAAATWLWNAALAANPVVLIIAAIAALTVGITALTGGFGKNTDAQKGFERQSNDTEDTIKRVDEALRGQLDAIDLNTRKLILAAKQRGASVKELSGIEIDAAEKSAQAEIAAAKARASELEKLNADEQRVFKERANSYFISQKGIDKIREEAATAQIKTGRLILEQHRIIEAAELSLAEKQYEAAEAAKKTSSVSSGAAKDTSDDIVSSLIKVSETSQRVSEARLKAELDYSNKSIRYRQEYEAKLFNIQQTGELERLKIQLSNAKITQAEYDAAYTILEAKGKEFYGKQSANLNAFVESEREAIIGMIGKTMDDEIVEVEIKYATAMKRLGEIGLQETEAAEMERLNLLERLENEKAARISAIRDRVAKEDADRRSAALNAEQAEIDATLKRELASANDNARKKYDAKMKALDAEAELYKGDAEREAEIDAEKLEAKTAFWGEMLAEAEKYASAVSGLLNAVSDLQAAGLERELQGVKDTYNKEKLALSEKHALGVLTEAQYNHELLKLDQQKEKDEAKIARQKAIQERTSKVFSVVTDTAMGIVKAVASSPVTFGLPWSAFAAATGALNLATILSEPLPKAARGGLISGPSHAAGGTVIEAEGGEAIMSKRAVSMFAPILSALNELGGGVPFAAPLSDGGFTLRSVSGQRSATAAEIAAAMKNVSIYTTVEDINRGQDQYAKIQSRGTLIS
jgi:hypothetical protein